MLKAISANFKINIPNLDLKSKFDLRSIHISAKTLNSIIDLDSESDDVMHLLGLPINVTKEEVMQMLEQSFGSSYIEGGNDAIHLLMNSVGTPSGEAFVEIKNKGLVEERVRLGTLMMGRKTLVVKYTTRSCMKEALTEASDEPTNFIFMRGLPFDSTMENIKNYFEGSNIDEINLSSAGSKIKPGYAYIKFSDSASADKAVQNHLEYWGRNKLEIYKITQLAYDNILLSPEQNESFVNAENSEHAIYLRGCPYNSTTNDVAEFLKPYQPYRIEIGDSRTGCIAYFSTAEEAKEAQSKHLSYMGSRYIEIRPYNTQIKRSPFASGFPMDSRGGEVNADQQNPVTKTEHGIYMRGLPFSANQDDVNEFFSPTTPVGVALFKERNGWASGNGVAYFATAAEASDALSKHLKYMGNRYIELSDDVSNQREISNRRESIRFGSTNEDPWSALHVQTTPTPMHSGLICNKSKSFLGRLIFGMKTSHMENTRGLHTLPVFNKCKIPILGTNFIRIAATIGRRIAKL